MISNNKTEEMVDWVDENDQKNRLLIQQRNRHKSVNPGLWIVSVAGHVGAGENPDQVAHKELQEELGFDTKLNFSFKELQRWYNETHFAYWYLGKYNGEKIVVDPDETETYDFVSSDSFDNFCRTYDVESNTKRIFKSYWKGEFYA